MDYHDPIWEAEFRGYFWGEGYIGAAFAGKVRPTTGQRVFRPVIDVTVRDDDIAVLRQFQARFGGSLIQGAARRTRSGTSNPSVVWRVTSYYHVRDILDVLKNGVLPAKKRRLLSLMDEFLMIRERNSVVGKNVRRRLDYTPEEINRIHEIMDEMKAIRAYSPPQEGQGISA